MRVEDLELSELLQVDPAGGLIRFGGERAVILDAVALGLLRKELIDTIGATAARGVLTRFGFAHGWRTAESLRGEFPWESEREWQTAGGRLHELQGLVLVEPVEPAEGAEGAPFAEAIWRESYEAEQHLLHLGLAEECVCWTLAGFASGYLTRCNGREIYCVEDRCRGRGDAFCHVVGRPREAWSDAGVKIELVHFERGCQEAPLERASAILKRTERRLRIRRHELERAAGGAGATDPSGLVARSEGMKRVIELARRVARVDATVLVTGESGVGKERVARLIHDESSRASGPFVAVNCAALTDTLLESELFGHARGSFTGATQDRPGLFEAASRGTLFLDEVGEVSPAVQAKLLRALEEREVLRVGENRSRKVDVRVLAATNKDLAREVKERRFREDLYYRLRVVELRIPPLRERRDDVLPLARLRLATAARRAGRRAHALTPEAADQLLRYPWPGNVRELENAIERAVALAAGDRVALEDLPEEVRVAAPATLAEGGVRTLAQLEREYILSVLRASGGHQGKTAKALGIGTATLYRKLRSYGPGAT